MHMPIRIQLHITPYEKQRVIDTNNTPPYFLFNIIFCYIGQIPVFILVSYKILRDVMLKGGGGISSCCK
jgi:hypothetical protein